MKNSLNIFLLALVLMIAQSCGSDSKKEASKAQTTAEKESKEVLISQRKAKLEKEKAERSELRAIEIAKLSSQTPTYKNAGGKVVFYKSEVAPSFAGGDKAMMAYLRDNVKFPAEAEDEGLEGTVFVDFVVTENGTVSEVEITDETSQSVDQSFRNEAVRVVTSMPKWVAGTQQGKAVDVRFSIPITFQMN